MKKPLVILLFMLCFAQLLFGQKAIVKGALTDESGYPIENVIIRIINHDLQTISDSYGHYTLHVPENQNIKIYFQHISHQDTIIEVLLKAKETQTINITLPAIGNRLDQVNINWEADNGYIRVNPKLSFQLPSPTGGMESLIKMLPGASSSNELSAQYNVRGGNYDENLIYVNDIEIYRPFLIRNAQQEGLGFVNTDLAGNVNFSAGGFDTQYGDKMSSVMDVQYKDPQQYGGSISGSILGASAHAEGLVDSCFSYLVGIRYKSTKYLLNSLETTGDYKPKFLDAQMLLKWDVTRKFSISLLGNFAHNSYIYQPTNRQTDFGSTTDVKRLTIYFDGQEVDRYQNYLGGLTFTFSPTKKDIIRLIFASYYAKESETYDIQGQYWLSDIEPDLGNSEGNIGQEVSIRGYGTYLDHARNYLTSIVSSANLLGEHRLPYNNTLKWGLKAQNEIIHDNINEWRMQDSSGYTLPAIPTVPGEAVPFDDPSRVLAFDENSILNTYNELNTLRFTGYVQDQYKIGGDSAHYILNAGVRFHYWTFSKKEVNISPRASFIYDPHWKRDWTFSLRTGLYYQPAFYREMRRPDGTLNDSLRSQRSVHIVAGTEYNFLLWRRPFKFTAEAYYKYMDRLISYKLDNVRIIYSGENDAKGYATGLDMKISGEFIKGLESWFALSLMKTEEDLLNDFYIDDDGNRVEPGYVPRPTDQRVAFNIFFQDHIPGYPQFRVHLNFVFASGLVYSAPNAEAYQRIRSHSWYRRVDLGFSFMFLEQSRDRMRNKSPFIRSIKNAGIYVEVFNLLGINNTSSYLWVSDIYNQYYPVPNYLTGRLVNVKFAVEW